MARKFGASGFGLVPENIKPVTNARIAVLVVGKLRAVVLPSVTIREEPKVLPL